MQHECKITVLKMKCFPDLQEKYLADPKSGPCPFFNTNLSKKSPILYSLLIKSQEEIEIILK